MGAQPQHPEPARQHQIAPTAPLSGTGLAAVVYQAVLTGAAKPGGGNKSSPLIALQLSWLRRQVSEPLEELSTAVQRMRVGEFPATFSPNAADDFANAQPGFRLLQAHLNQVAGAIQSEARAETTSDALPTNDAFCRDLNEAKRAQSGPRRKS